MRIRLVSDIDYLKDSVAAQLVMKGHSVEQIDDESDRCELRYASSAPLDALSSLMQALSPLLPEIKLVDDLDGAEAELLLGDEDDLDEWRITTKSNSRRYAQNLHSRLLKLGFEDNDTEVVTGPENVIKFGGASAFSRQVVRWVLSLDGIQITDENKVWDDDDHDIYVIVSDSAASTAGDSTTYLNTPISLEGDDFKALFELKEALEIEGFTDLEVRPLDTVRGKEFRFETGGFGGDDSTIAKVSKHIETLLETAGVEPQRYPLKVESSSGDRAVIRLPLGLHGSGKLYSYAGSFPDRWDVVLRTDVPNMVDAVTAKLAEKGYTRTRTEALPKLRLGVNMRYGAASSYEDVIEEVRECISATIEGFETPEEIEVKTGGDLASSDHRIVIDIPKFVIEGGDITDQILAACSDWECKLYAPDLGELSSLSDRLREFNFKNYNTEHDDDVDEPIVKYGGAPPELVEYVAGVVEEETGVRPRTSKVWSDSDDDIWVYLPRRDEIVPTRTEEPEAPDLQSWFEREDDKGDTELFLALRDEDLRVGHVTLPRRKVKGRDEQLVPPREAFNHYCLDQRTSESLVHVAESAALREPCLLEGETSVSKTSVIQYLAMLLNQPLVRINLNGQTDTGELVGRFVPRDDDQDDGHPWRWQDGLVIEAMKRGWWVVLDELNLAEPQILERLNSVLEREPSIILTEYDNSLIGTGGVPLHPHFRIFGTMNPAEYAGRSPLSPAYRDRWRGYKFVTMPGELEYRAMLHFMVTGQHPDVTLYGLTFSGGRQEAPYPQLRDIPHIDEFLAALARFHTTLEGATIRTATGAKLGARRRERYVFTRRGLLSMMDFLVRQLHESGNLLTMRAALVRYYINRLSSTQDQTTVLRLMDAAGIGPNTWTIGESQEEKADDDAA